MIKSIFFCFFYALLNVSGAAIIKWKLKERSLSVFNDWLRLLLDVHIIGAFILLFCSALVLFQALSSGNFSFIIPISVGINFILTVMVGYFLFKDQINIVSFIGFALIISGIVLLSINTTQHAK
jgi:multidrug transporter EmrE-like cation transporter